MSISDRRFQINVRLTEDEKSKLKMLATALGLSDGELVRALIDRAHARFSEADPKVGASSLRKKLDGLQQGLRQRVFG